MNNNNDVWMRKLKQLEKTLDGLPRDHFFRGLDYAEREAMAKRLTAVALNLRRLAELKGGETGKTK